MNQILWSGNKHKTSWKQNMISGVFQEAPFDRNHVQERKSVCVPRESSFSIIDVVRRTHTHYIGRIARNIGLMILGTLKLIGYFQRNGSVSFSSLLKNTPLQGYTWSGRDDEATSRPQHVWPELWSGMSKKSQQKEKHMSSAHESVRYRIQ